MTNARTWRSVALPRNRSQHFYPTLLLTAAKIGGLPLGAFLLEQNDEWAFRSVVT